MKKHYYLAYGSNLNIEQMSTRCKTAKAIGTALIKDYELLFKGSSTGSYLTIEPCQGEVVPVGVWEVIDEDIAALDKYEDYPNYYQKEEMQVDVTSLSSGEIKTLNCFVYIMNKDKKLAMPSEKYVKTCLEGYLNFNFDKKNIEDAISKVGDCK